MVSYIHSHTLHRILLRLILRCLTQMCIGCQKVACILLYGIVYIFPHPTSHPAAPYLPLPHTHVCRLPESVCICILLHGIVCIFSHVCRVSERLLYSMSWVAEIHMYHMCLHRVYIFTPYTPAAATVRFLTPATHTYTHLPQPMRAYPPPPQLA